MVGGIHSDGPVYFIGPGDPNYKVELCSWPGSAGVRVKGWGAVQLATDHGDVVTVTEGNVGIWKTNPETTLHLGTGAIKIDTRLIADTGGCYYA